MYTYETYITYVNNDNNEDERDYVIYLYCGAGEVTIPRGLVVATHYAPRDDTYSVAEAERNVSQILRYMRATNTHKSIDEYLLMCQKLRKLHQLTHHKKKKIMFIWTYYGHLLNYVEYILRSDPVFDFPGKLDRLG